jgi:hypothetical protein
LRVHCSELAKTVETSGAANDLLAAALGVGTEEP